MNKIKNWDIVQANLNILLNDGSSALIVLSKGGLGKTTYIFNALKKKKLQHKKHYLYYNSYFTPLGFYQTLIKTTYLKQPKLLILDDVELILQDKQIMNFIKAATWENQNGRIINYVSSAKKSKIPDSINFDGKIIMLLNEMPKNNPILQAVKDRILFCELKWSNQQILDYMQQKIVNQPYKNLSYVKRIKIFNFIKKHFNSKTNLTLRLLIKSYNYYIFSPNNWQELVLDLLTPIKMESSDINNNNWKNSLI